MFGYLTPDKPEMKMREYDCYRAHYCGVCFALKKRYGLPCSALLTYDAAFLALVGCAAGKPAKIRKARCVINPLRRVLVAEGEAVDYAADANLLLAEGKCRDNWQDERNLLGGAGAILLRSAAKKAALRLGEAATGVDGALQTLGELEKEGSVDIDATAAAFGRALQALADGMQPGETYKAALSWLGFNVGRWLYLLDAYDDLDKDEKNKSYNVLIKRFGSAQAARQERERVEFNLLHSLSEAGKALSLLPANEFSTIADYIVGGGALARTQKVLSNAEECK